MSVVFLDQQRGTHCLLVEIIFFSKYKIFSCQKEETRPRSFGYLPASKCYETPFFISFLFLHFFTCFFPFVMAKGVKMPKRSFKPANSGKHLFTAQNTQHLSKSTTPAHFECQTLANQLWLPSSIFDETGVKMPKRSFRPANSVQSTCLLLKIHNTCLSRPHHHTLSVRH